MLETLQPQRRKRSSSVKMSNVSKIRWRLADLLEQYDVTAYQVGDYLGGHKKMPIIYRLADTSKPPVKANFETIRDILDALRALTGENITLADLIEYTPDT